MRRGDDEAENTRWMDAAIMPCFGAGERGGVSFVFCCLIEFVGNETQFGQFPGQGLFFSRGLHLSEICCPSRSLFHLSLRFPLLPDRWIPAGDIYLSFVPERGRARRGEREGQAEEKKETRDNDHNSKASFSYARPAHDEGRMAA